MDRNALAQLMALVAQRGNHPMGGPQPYANDIPAAPSIEQVPSGWLPPGSSYNQAPQGNFLPAPPPMSVMPIPRFHIPLGKQLNRRDGALT